MNLIDKKTFIEWAERRMAALNDEIMRDFGGGMSNKLGHYNEVKTIKEMAQRGCFDIKVWE
ncbi:hypothetical protein WKH57_01390 [Niallia taxi]|uniref:hypothetical protein n=1 Tax=Niallia taxi TaxID=2499688 RepID=UPI00316C9B10